jgi:hypothetical protein
MEALRQEAEMGKNMSHSAKGRMDTATLGSGIYAANAKNTQAGGEAEIKTMIDGFTKLSSDLESATAQYGPAGLSQIIPRMPPELQAIAKQLEQAGQLDKFPLVINHMRDTLVQKASDTPALRGDMTKETQKFGFTTASNSQNNEASMARENSQNATSRANALTMAEARTEAADIAAAAKEKEKQKAEWKYMYGALQKDEEALADELSIVNTTAFKGTKEEKAKQKADALMKLQLKKAAIEGKKAFLEQQLTGQGQYVAPDKADPLGLR